MKTHNFGSSEQTDLRSNWLDPHQPSSDKSELTFLDAAKPINELRKHQEELCRQNEELKRAYEELGLANDELRQINDCLSEARDRYLDLYDFAPVGYVTLDNKGRILEHNRRLTEMLERGHDALDLQRFATFVSAHDQDDFHLTLRFLLSGEPGARRTLDLRLLHAGGTDLWVRTDWVAMSSKDAPAALRVAIGDIAEYKDLQAQLAQADRMASVGLLAAGMAHEINNPLTYVLFNVESVAEGLPALAKNASVIDPDLLEDMIQRLTSAVEGAKRIRDIVGELRVFSRINDGRFETTDVSEVMESAINMALNEIRYRAELDKRYEGAALVRANPGQLCQVFLNLLTNAVHAIKEGDVKNNRILIRIRQEADEILVEVGDTGHGIPSENLNRIFEAFFTTKGPGAGSGLGLSICEKIISAHFGRISVKSTVGKGTTFVIRLPAASTAKSPEARVTQPHESHAEVWGRVLVIDDEPGVRQVIASMLAGHDVTLEESGAAGRERIEKGQHFDAILCDLMMPGFSGMDLYDWLREAHPDVADRMVFITGGAFTPRSRALLKYAHNLHLAKPFTRDTLCSSVREIILSERDGES